MSVERKRYEEAARALVEAKKAVNCPIDIVDVADLLESECRKTFDRAYEFGRMRGLREAQMAIEEDIRAYGEALKGKP